ncbi:unnamed protein product [Pleuronectes platessa]|uniref:Uncharacterized protein n=1 Tax=Pleuronectes platessa TaxID=8262 RepID=A0A9N7YIN7_PLEPL|nr:unnamed protein product [Pleuronectes platessa]
MVNISYTVYLLHLCIRAHARMCRLTLQPTSIESVSEFSITARPPSPSPLLFEHGPGMRRRRPLERNAQRKPSRRKGKDIT